MTLRCRLFTIKSHLWRYLVDTHQLDVTESAFRKFISKHSEFQNYFNRKSHKSTHSALLRFESEPGQQLQIDWKEDIKFITSDCESLSLNVFVAVLSYSRYGVYIVTLNKKQETLLNALDKVFEHLGGVPSEVVSDNMKTIMDYPRTIHSPGVINSKFEQFAKDYGFELKPCVVGQPSSKGKVETQMKLLDELYAYQGKLSYPELIEKVAQLNLRKNMNIHSGTGKSPINLVQKEKDFLQALPNKAIRSPYQYYRQTHKVNQSAMITYKSQQYSVPPEYIGKQLYVELIDEQLHIYDNTKLVTIHNVTTKKLNYHSEHYRQLVQSQHPYYNDQTITDVTMKQLKRIGDFYDEGHE